MKRSIFVSIFLAVVLSLNLAAPAAMAAPKAASTTQSVQLLTTAQKAAAAKSAAVKTATKKVSTTKSTFAKANTTLKKAQNNLNKAQAAYDKANAALQAANGATVKKATANLKKAQAALKTAKNAFNKANSAAQKANSQYDAAVKVLQSLTGKSDTANYTITTTDTTTTTNPQAQPAPAAAGIDASAIVGLSQDQLVAQFGQPSRTEPSEYGFTWLVYNNDYSRFLMAGVRDGAVVALYTNAKGFQYGSAFTLGSSIDAVRAAMGTPVTSLRSGNTISMLPHTDEKDLFIVGDKDVTVFYDKIEGGVVTSVMVLPNADEVAYVTGGQPMTEELGAAYARLSVDLTNAIRVRRGLKALTVDGQNANLALNRSNDMRDRNYFDHITPDNVSPADQAKAMGISYSSLGENIAYGHRDAIFASERFMNSAGHRANVLKDYAKIGVGVAVGGDMRVLITCIFTK